MRPGGTPSPPSEGWLSAPWWARAFGVAVVAIILLVLVKHLAGGGPRHHMG